MGSFTYDIHQKMRVSDPLPPSQKILVQKVSVVQIPSPLSYGRHK